jgi:hypothetical protein
MAGFLRSSFLDALAMLTAYNWAIGGYGNMQDEVHSPITVGWCSGGTMNFWLLRHSWGKGLSIHGTSLAAWPRHSTASGVAVELICVKN